MLPQPLQFLHSHRPRVGDLNLSPLRSHWPRRCLYSMGVINARYFHSISAVGIGLSDFVKPVCISLFLRVCHAVALSLLYMRNGTKHCLKSEKDSLGTYWRGTVLWEETSQLRQRGESELADSSRDKRCISIRSYQTQGNQSGIQRREKPCQ